MGKGERGTGGENGSRVTTVKVHDVFEKQYLFLKKNLSLRNINFISMILR